MQYIYNGITAVLMICVNVFKCKSACVENAKYMYMYYSIIGIDTSIKSREQGCIMEERNNIQDKFYTFISEQILEVMYICSLSNHE